MDGQADSRTGGPAHPAALCGHEPGTAAVLGVLWGEYPECQYTDGVCDGCLSFRGLVRGAGAHLGQGRAVACSQSYIEQLSRAYSAATVKQNLAALRQLFDWLVVGQVMRSNPASAVRGPKQIIKIGKTPVLTAAETRSLLDSIDPSTLIGLRDRALMGLMVYGFARVSAALAMQVADYYTQGKRSYFRLHEKGGKYLVIPAHHMAQAWTDEYVDRAGLAADPKGPLFPSAGTRRGIDQLTRQPLARADALKMIKRRGGAAGLPAQVCAHSFRGTGITKYLRAGGTLETAARIAGHESTRTTQLYNRLQDEVSLDEIERIHI